MTKKSFSRASRDKQGLPPFDEIAGAYVDQDSKLIAFVTKDILKKQLSRDSRRIEKSFDRHAPRVLMDSSEFLANAYLKHLPILNALKVQIAEQLAQGSYQQPAIHLLRALTLHVADIDCSMQLCLDRSTSY